MQKVRGIAGNTQEFQPALGGLHLSFSTEKQGTVFCDLHECISLVKCPSI